MLTVYCSLVSRRRRTAERTEAAAVVEYTQAPPATTRLQRLQDQMPTQARFMESLPQNEQVYLLCWVISIFLTILRREAHNGYHIYLRFQPSWCVRPFFSC